MKPATLLKLYPKSWRDRYGDEFAALLEKEGTGPRVVLSVMAGAFDAWMSPGTPAEMVMDGPFSPRVLLEKTDPKEGLWSASHWRYLGVAMGAGLLANGLGHLLHPGRAFPVSFMAGFMAAMQLWVLRHYSVRTRIAACFWAFALLVALPMLLHVFLHRLVYPLLGQ